MNTQIIGGDMGREGSLGTEPDEVITESSTYVVKTFPSHKLGKNGDRAYNATKRRSYVKVDGNWLIDFEPEFFPIPDIRNMAFEAAETYAKYRPCSDIEECCCSWGAYSLAFEDIAKSYGRSSRTPKVVDIGCAFGTQTRFIRDLDIDYLGLDVTYPMGQDDNLDVHRIPFFGEEYPNVNYEIEYFDGTKLPKGDFLIAFMSIGWICYDESLNFYDLARKIKDHSDYKAVYLKVPKEVKVCFDEVFPRRSILEREWDKEWGVDRVYKYCTKEE